VAVSLRNRIRAFIADELMHGDPGVVLDDDRPLLELGILDSLGLQRMLAFLEREYGVAFRDEEIVPDHFESIGTIAALVEKHRQR